MVRVATGPDMRQSVRAVGTGFLAPDVELGDVLAQSLAGDSPAGQVEETRPTRAISPRIA